MDAALLEICSKERPSHRYDTEVPGNQSAIDGFLALPKDLLMVAPNACMIYLIDEVITSNKAIREHHPELALYWIWFSDKIIQVIMARLDEFSPEIQTKFGSIIQDIRGQGNNAVKAFEAAADKEFVLAQYYLGYMYRKGSCVPQDNVLARKWYTIAAQNGHPHAQQSLEFMDLNGI